MFVRIKYLTSNIGSPILDSYVAAIGSSLDEAISQLSRVGFVRFSTESRYDEEERIMPGAIMSVAPCDERGYTKHDLAEIKRTAESRLQDRSKSWSQSSSGQDMGLQSLEQRFDSALTPQTYARIDP